MRKWFIIGIAAIALVALLVPTIRWLPDDTQAVRVAEDGELRGVGSGLHMVRPWSAAWIRYPAGTVERRFPASGRMEALSVDGAVIRLAMSLRLGFSPDTALRLHRLLGADWEAGLRRLVRDAVEIGAARRGFEVSDEAPPDFADSIVQELGQTVANAGIRVLAYRIESWSVSADAPTVEVPASPLRRVVFVGVDGADWDVIRPLIDDGSLPNFKKLVEKGATGPLRTIEPMLSPLIWTSIATGKLPEEHGILNFTVVDPETGRKVPISRLYRKVDAFWNMLSDYGRSVDIVGWLATFPAESINGVMVTDRVGYLAYADAEDEGGPLKGSVHPEDRMEELSRLVVSSRAVMYDEFPPFMAIDRETFIGNRSVPFDPKNPINNMIMLYASTESYRRIARHLVETDQPDALAVYFELVDATKHLFMQYAPPLSEDVDAGAYEMFKDAVRQAYVLQDEILGELIELAGPRTVVIVVSDHGFKSGPNRPRLRPEIWAGKAAFWHELDGIICLYGDGVRAGATLDRATILDMAPTLLALQGLPKPADMPGRVLEEAFEPVLVSQFNRTPVATLQRQRTMDAGASVVDAATEETLKKLEALGYITPDNPDAHNNLGQRYQEQGEYEKAIDEFKKALAIRPNFPPALNNLGVCYGHLRRWNEAEAAFKKALELNPRDVHAMNNLAIMFLQIEKPEVALEYGRRAVSVEPNYANARVTLGSTYATLRRFDEAEREFLQALEIDPTNRNAKANLERVRRESNAN